MAIIVDPLNEESNFHIKLTDSRGRAIGLKACTADGTADPRSIKRDPYRGSNVVTKPPGGRYDDRQPPYIAVEMNEWSGGRGQEDFERNKAKFRDSGGVWTVSGGKAYLAPSFHLTTGYVSMDKDYPDSVSFVRLYGAERYVGRTFAASASHTIGQIGLLLRYVGSPGTLTIEVCSDSTGDPGSVLKTNTFTTASMDSDRISEFYMIQMASTQALTSGTSYWIKVYGAATDDLNNYWQVGCQSTGTASKKSSDNSAWTTVDYDMCYMAMTATAMGRTFFFEYKRAWYKLVNPPAGAAPKLYLNGYRGVATGTHSTTTLQDTTQSYTADALIGGILLLSDGDSARGQWRPITDNDGDTITVSPAFDIAPTDATTEYVVLGMDTWTEITGHGITKSSTWRPLVVNDVIYVPQGDSTAIRRLNYYNTAGTWTARYADDGTNKATIIIKGKGSSSTVEVYVFNNSDASSNVSMSHGDGVSWGTSLTLTNGSSPVKLGGNQSRIIGAIYYDGLRWAIKEDDLIAIDDSDNIDSVLPDLQWMRSEYTGSAVAFQMPYLYYNMARGFLQEFYGRVQQDIGPNRDEGLPLDRQGPVSAIQPSAKWLFVAVNGENAGYSGIFCYSSGGWGEIYRGSYGDPVRDLGYQVIPGLPARLWIGSEDVTGYLEMAESAWEPRLDSRVNFRHEGYVTTSYISDNLLDIDKHWAHLKMWADKLSNDVQYIEVDYRVDDDTDSDWVTFGPFTESPSEELLIGNGKVTGKRIQFRFRFYTNDSTKTPLMKSAVPDYIGRYPTDHIYKIRFLVDDIEGEGMEDIQGDESTLTADDVREFLEQAKNDPVPMQMDCVVKAFNDTRVIPDPTSYVVVDVAPGESQSLIGSMQLLGVR